MSSTADVSGSEGSVAMSTVSLLPEDEKTSYEATVDTMDGRSDVKAGMTEQGDALDDPWDAPSESPSEESFSSKNVHEAVSVILSKVDALTARLTSAQEHTGASAKLTEEEEDALLLWEAQNDVRAPVWVESQPKCIVGGTMKPYQIDGLNWLYQLYMNNAGGILADEMGLGKTLQTIALLGFLKEVGQEPDGPHLVVCPRSTLDNWRNEFQRWCPSLAVVQFWGQEEQRDEMFQTVLRSRRFDVCLTTYEMVLRERRRLSSLRWRYLVVDEAHRVKNEKAALSVVIRALSPRYPLLITGTPLQNNLKELWALLNFVMPDLFSSSQEFHNVFDFAHIQDEKDRQFVLHALHRTLRPFMLRRLKADVACELPPKRELFIFVGMSTLQKKLYASIVSKNIDVLQAMTGGKKSEPRLLNILMQLRKAVCHPFLFEGIEKPQSDGTFSTDESIINVSGKMVMLDRLLTRLRAVGSRVLIFSQMTRMLDIIDDYMHWKHLVYCRIDGNTPGTERQERIDGFNAENSEIFAFLLSTRAGGLGINLATADSVILFDSDFNPQLDLQAIDRAHRLGQKKTVSVFRLVTEGTVEERIIERAARKRTLDLMVVKKSGLADTDKNKGPSTSELLEIIQFGAQEVYRSQEENSIVDKDIDALLAAAEHRTQEINTKLATLEKTFDLTKFSLDGGLNLRSLQDAASDMTSVLSTSPPSTTFIELGERVNRWKINDETKRPVPSKTTYEGWRAAANGGFDFQFFNAKRLDRLDEIERKWEDHKKRKSNPALKDLPADVLRQILATISAETSQDVSDEDVLKQVSEILGIEASCRLPTATGEDLLSELRRRLPEGGSPQSTRSQTPLTEGSPQKKSPPRKQRKVFAFLQPLRKDPQPFTKKLVIEREELLAKGFPQWCKSEYLRLVRSCSVNGRHDLDQLVEDVATKTKEEIKDYLNFFISRHKEVAGGERYVQRMEQREAALREEEERARSVSAWAVDVVGLESPPTAKTVYTIMQQQLHRGETFLPKTLKRHSTFREEEDRGLLAAMVVCGAQEDSMPDVHHLMQYFYDDTTLGWRYAVRHDEGVVAERCADIARAVVAEMKADRKKSKGSPSASSRKRPKLSPRAD